MTENSGIADKDIELAVALGDGAAKAIDGVALGQIEGDQRGARSGFPYPIIGLLEPAYGAGDQEELGALGGEALGDRGANAPARRRLSEPPGRSVVWPRSGGDQCPSDNSDNCAGRSPSSRSVSEVG